MGDDPKGSTQMSSQQPKPFQEFPTELWVKVIASIEPRDVLSLSTTCRLLRSMLHQRGVWVSVLHSFCLREGLFQLSYSFEKMDLGALQRAALGPYRWKRLIEKHHANDIEGVSNVTELEPISTTNLPNAWPFDRDWCSTCLYLVPGGRFLLTTRKSSLQLWDNGPVGEAHRVGSHVVAEHVLEENAGYPMGDLTACIVDERKLRVGVATFGQQELVIQIFEISPSEHDAGFVELGTFRIIRSEEEEIHPNCRLWLHPSCVFISTSGTGILWDFMLGHYTVLSNHDSSVYETGFTGAFVVGFRNGSMSLWSVPFEERYLCSVPQGAISILEAAERLNPPLMPDLIVDLVLSQDNPEYAIVANPDPYSLIFEVWPLLPANHPSYISSVSVPSATHSHHRVVIKQDPTDRHQIEANVQHLCSFRMPPDYDYFEPIFSELGIRRPPELGVMGTGDIALSPNPSRSPICLRTIALDIRGMLSVGHAYDDDVARGGTFSSEGNPTTATVTFIREYGCEYGSYAMCIASGRAASTSRPISDTKSLSFHDYLG